MRTIIDVIYENGVFRPVTDEQILLEEFIDLAGRVYDGLTEDEVREIE